MISKMNGASQVKMIVVLQLVTKNKNKINDKHKYVGRKNSSWSA